MKYSTLINSICFFVLSLGLSTHFAYAGAVDGGGGGAFVKRDAAGQILDVDLLDLFEVEEIKGYKVVKNNDRAVNEQVEAILLLLKSIDYTAWSDTTQAWQIVKTHQRLTKVGIKIEKPADAHNRFHKDGYEFEGMMYFDDLSDLLYINKEIFEAQKTNTEKAAALVHESIYKGWRTHHLEEHDSTLARTITGCLFTTEPLKCLNLAPNPGRLPAPVGKDTRTVMCKSAPGPHQTVLRANLYSRYVEQFGNNCDPIAFTFGNCKYQYEYENVLALKVDGTPVRTRIFTDHPEIRHGIGTLDWLPQVAIKDWTDYGSTLWSIANEAYAEPSPTIKIKIARMGRHGKSDVVEERLRCN